MGSIVICRTVHTVQTLTQINTEPLSFQERNGKDQRKSPTQTLGVNGPYHGASVVAKLVDTRKYSYENFVVDCGVIV